MLQLHNVFKTYKTEAIQVPVLQRLSLLIEQGEFVAIMGPSGSGKSTLMSIIGLLDTITSGTYFLNGKDVSVSSDKELAKYRNKHIGFVFQQFHLLPRLSALANTELPLIYAREKKKIRKEKAHRALEIVGLRDRMNHYPNQLSGGQKQRVAIARAIINNPDVILADEPTGSLDSKTGEQVMSIFSEFNREGKTIILVTHEPEIAQYAQRTILLRDGIVVEDRRR
ncbi:ABC transporter ATP-binding protein [Paenibacillus chondroitinus]|uniref:ABC transporter ATP-binding protein n=1 Tax=Paenibacillus chondroitinus TaxID=59842 RepID=A0ABU6DLR1_9BACL|nr:MULTISPECIES: ABC transporter ATP-binding protein [Paenibacillus]MCY9657569.1 ABC transporter ATP-binding protein [Paenibacillus anseongense]MEB4797781.1 ABC transporter ATP-binding protein [Paenibacillus chondroitinus]